MRSVTFGCVCICMCYVYHLCVRVTQKHLFTHLLVKYLCEKGAYCSPIHLYVTILRCLQDVQRVLLYFCQVLLDVSSIITVTS